MKKILALMLVLVLLMCMAGCNYAAIDPYHYDRAIISLPDGQVVAGAVSSWWDYEGDQLQITIDGVTYLAHAANVTLIAE